MDSNLAIRYAGRAGGAALAYFTVGHKLGTAGMLAVVALGWLAGGFAIDQYQGASSAGTPVPGV